MDGRRVLQAVTHIAALVLGILGYGSVANAQRPTPEEINSMMHLPSHKLAYYKWADGAPIRPLIVTGRQRGSCVDITVAKVRRQAGLIRDLVPQLRNLYDPEPIDWIPQIQHRSPMLLGLDMANPAIVQAMSRYGRSNNPSATFTEFDNSSHLLGFAQGFGLEDRRIVASYAWTLTSGGLSSYDDDVCRKSEWDTIGLMNLLGGQAFNALASSWGEKQSDTGRTFMKRLFLKALYACPGSPANRDCVRAELQSLVEADSFSIPEE